MDIASIWKWRLYILHIITLYCYITYWSYIVGIYWDNNNDGIPIKFWLGNHPEIVQDVWASHLWLLKIPMDMALNCIPTLIGIWLLTTLWHQWITEELFSIALSLVSKIWRLNVKKQQGVCESHGIKSIPTPCESHEIKINWWVISSDFSVYQCCI